MTIAEARQHLSALIQEVETFDEHVLITKNGRPAAVIVSADEWEEIDESAFWRSVPDITSDIAAARKSKATPLDDLVAKRRSKQA